MDNSPHWLSGIYQICDFSKLLAIIMFAVMSTGLNCLHDIVIACFCISKDQMSMHELFSLEIGGLDEEDDRSTFGRTKRQTAGATSRECRATRKRAKTWRI